MQEIQPDGRYTYIYTNLYSYNPLAQVRDWTTEDGEGVQQAYYFHCDQIGIPRENFPEGDFLVGAHGNSSIVATNGSNQNLFTLKQLAELIKQHPQYSEGKPVTLVACQTGKGDNSFAQKLANELKAPVRGATENVSAVTGELLNGGK